MKQLCEACQKPKEIHFNGWCKECCDALDKVSNKDLLNYNYIRLPCGCILDRYTDVIVFRVCNFHKNLIIGKEVE